MNLGMDNEFPTDAKKQKQNNLSNFRIIRLYAREAERRSLKKNVEWFVKPSTLKFLSSSPKAFYLTIWRAIYLTIIFATIFLMLEIH